MARNWSHLIKWISQLSEDADSIGDGTLRRQR